MHSLGIIILQSFIIHLMHRSTVAMTTRIFFFIIFLILLFVQPHSISGFAANNKRASSKAKRADQHQKPPQQPNKGFGTPPAPTWQQEAEKYKNRRVPPSLLLLDSSLPCPCGGGGGVATTPEKSYDKCCAPYHRGDAYPESPRLLLQSRYSAFVLTDIRYIIETTHPINADWREDKLAWVKELNGNMFDNHDFLSLNVSDSEEEMMSETEEYLTFTVRLRGKEGSEFDTKQDMIIRERSRFLKDDEGQWLYASGEVSIVQE
jgi:SEC-C motif domain protein